MRSAGAGGAARGGPTAGVDGCKPGTAFGTLCGGRAAGWGNLPVDPWRGPGEHGAAGPDGRNPPDCKHHRAGRRRLHVRDPHGAGPDLQLPGAGGGERSCRDHPATGGPFCDTRHGGELCGEGDGHGTADLPVAAQRRTGGGGQQCGADAAEGIRAGLGRLPAAGEQPGVTGGRVFAGGAAVGERAGDGDGGASGREGVAGRFGDAFGGRDRRWDAALPVAAQRRGRGQRDGPCADAEQRERAGHGVF